MAGAGYKLFNTGDVLTAAQVNTYLQEQVVMVFADATARTTALSGVLAEGMVSYLKDTDALEIYSGAAWVGYGSGDITGVTAGTGISGGGTSGTVTITNSMATDITAAGDIIVGTGSGTFDNLPIGTTGQVLTADTTVSPYKVKWATSSSGGMTLLSTTTTNTGSSYTISSLSTSYTNLYLQWEGLSCTSGASITLAFASGNASVGGVNQDGTAITVNAAALKLHADTQSSGNAISCTIYNYAASASKTVDVRYGGLSAGWRGGGYQGFHSYASAISEVTVAISTGSFSAGTLKIYGVK